MLYDEEGGAGERSKEEREEARYRGQLGGRGEGFGRQKSHVGRIDRPEEEDGRPEGHGQIEDSVPFRAQRAEEGGGAGGISQGRGGGRVTSVLVGNVVVVVVIGRESRERKGKDEGVAGIGGGCRTTKVDVNPSSTTATTATAVSRRKQHGKHIIHKYKKITDIRLHTRSTSYNISNQPTTPSTFNSSISTSHIKRRRHLSKAKRAHPTAWLEAESDVGRGRN